MHGSCRAPPPSNSDPFNYASQSDTNVNDPEQSSVFPHSADNDDADGMNGVHQLDDLDEFGCVMSSSHVPSISKGVFEFYDLFGDTTIPIFNKAPSLCPPWDVIPEHIKSSIIYTANCSMSRGDCHLYYEHILQRDMTLTSSTSTDHPIPLSHFFPTADRFFNYTVNFNKAKVVDEGWVRAKITINTGNNQSFTNENGCFRCPLKLLENIFLKSGGTLSSIIPFKKQMNRANERTFSSPWDTFLYEQYCSSVNFGNVIMVDFFADGCTLSRSGTQSGVFIRVRFPNIKGFSEKWFDIGIAPTQKQFPEYLPEYARRRLRALLYHRFLFLMMKKMAKASYHGLIINGVTLVPRIGMLIADQPEERMLLCLKGHDSFMDCSLCTLPSRISSQDNATSEDEPTPTRQHSVSNRVGQLRSDFYSPRPVGNTVTAQLELANHKLHGKELGRNRLLSILSFLIKNSAHDFPSFLASFDGLGSAPFLLFCIIVFDKLHVFDLGLIRNFTDMICLIIQKHNNQLPLTRLIAILNDRYVDLPPSARLPGLRPFRLNSDDVQAGMSGKVRRLSAPFLWVCVMGVSDKDPDEDDVLQCALQLDRVNQFLCGTNEINVRHLTLQDINDWQDFLFQFGRQMSTTFDMDVTTKMHRVMRHVKHQLVMHGCIKRSSTEENEHQNKKHKKAYRLTNKHLDTIGVQLLRAHVHTDEVASSSDSDTSDGELPSTDTSISSTWSQLESLIHQTTEAMSGSFHPKQISSCLLEKRNQETGWPYLRSLKRFRMETPCVPISKHLKHKTLCAGNEVYGKTNRHDSIEFVHDFGACIGTIESILAPVGFGFSSSMRILLVRLLVQVDPDHGNSLVVTRYGHKRYKYAISDTFRVKTVCIKPSDIIRPALLVVDPYWAKSRFGITTRLKDVPDSDDIRCDLRFFHVKGVSFTSVGQVKGSK